MSKYYNINFDSVDFSERRPEEVMFLLTLSVLFTTLVVVWPYSVEKITVEPHTELC